MSRTATLALMGLLLAALGGCMRDYSPNTYASAAAQQANKVTQGVVIGYREVVISADGTVGTVTGGAAGGVLGAQTPGSGVVTALGTIGGTLLGGLIGTGIEHAAGDTRAFEYLVRQTDKTLVSVTQRDEQPLPVGEKVLVIAGNQARIVRDYSQPVPEEAAPATLGKEAGKEAPATETTTPGAQTSPPADPAEIAPSDAPGVVGPPVRLVPLPSGPVEPASEAAPMPEPALVTEPAPSAD